MGKGTKHGKIEFSLKTSGYFRTGPRPPIRQLGFPGRTRFDGSRQGKGQRNEIARRFRQKDREKDKGVSAHHHSFARRFKETKNLRKTGPGRCN